MRGTNRTATCLSCGGGQYQYVGYWPRSGGNRLWSTTCTDTSVCSAGHIQDCGHCSTQTCVAAGEVWNGQDDGPHIPYGCHWGACPAETCVPGATVGCTAGGQAGTKTCSDHCAWSSCVATQCGQMLDVTSRINCCVQFDQKTAMECCQGLPGPDYYQCALSVYDSSTYPRTGPYSMEASNFPVRAGDILLYVQDGGITGVGITILHAAGMIRDARGNALDYPLSHAAICTVSIGDSCVEMVENQADEDAMLGSVMYDGLDTCPERYWIPNSELYQATPGVHRGALTTHQKGGITLRNTSAAEAERVRQAALYYAEYVYNGVEYRYDISSFFAHRVPFGMCSQFLYDAAGYPSTYPAAWVSATESGPFYEYMIELILQGTLNGSTADPNGHSPDGNGLWAKCFNLFKDRCDNNWLCSCSAQRHWSACRQVVNQAVAGVFGNLDNVMHQDRCGRLANGSWIDRSSNNDPDVDVTRCQLGADGMNPDPYQWKTSQGRFSPPLYGGSISNSVMPGHLIGYHGWEDAGSQFWLPASAEYADRRMVIKRGASYEPVSRTQVYDAIRVENYRAQFMCNGDESCYITFVNAAEAAVLPRQNPGSHVLNVPGSARCGDAVCNAPGGVQETCVTCPTDCVKNAPAKQCNPGEVQTQACNGCGTQTRNCVPVQADFSGCVWPATWGACSVPGGLANGAACSCSGQCNSGQCVDGVCCNTACNNGPCAGCNVPGLAGTCSPKAAGAVCRAAAGGCDVAETCNGTSTACPADSFMAANTTCRAAAGTCDVAETCSGTSPLCPADSFVAAGTECRAAAGPCDVAETCTGAAAVCPADAKRPSTYVCRAAVGVCDAAELCDGTSDACPADAKVAAGTVCRAAVGGCDVAETCNGTSAACPADAFVAAGTQCAAAAACENASTCTGTSGVCTHSYKPSSTLCRASAGACDVAETCSGSAAACPADAKVAAGTVCRAAVGACDAAELCDGTSAACPADALLAAGTVCRAAAGGCDVAEKCTGTSTACPADSFMAANTTCRAAAGTCDVAEKCSGTSAACPADAFVAAGTVCRASTGPCDPAEVCSGTAAACPADGNGTCVVNAYVGANNFGGNSHAYALSPGGAASTVLHGGSSDSGTCQVTSAGALKASLLDWCNIDRTKTGAVGDMCVRAYGVTAGDCDSGTDLTECCFAGYGMNLVTVNTVNCNGVAGTLSTRQNPDVSITSNVFAPQGCFTNDAAFCQRNSVNKLRAGYRPGGSAVASWVYGAWVAQSPGVCTTATASGKTVKCCWQ